MQVSVWNNGESAYGIRIGKPNRDTHFRRDWTEIAVELDGAVHRFPLTDGFWNDCPEVRSPVIREWLSRQGLAEWPRNDPPKFELLPLGDNRFRLLQPSA